MATHDQKVLKVLRAQCAAVGVPTTGTKDDLTQRLKAHTKMSPAAKTASSVAGTDKSTSLTIPTDFYQAEKKELLEIGITDEAFIEREIQDRYQAHLSSAAVDEKTKVQYIFGEPLNENQRTKNNLTFVGMTPDGEFEYRKVAAKPAQPAQPKLAAPVISAAKVVSAAKPAKSILKKPKASPRNPAANASALKSVVQMKALKTKASEVPDSSEAPGPFQFDAAFLKQHLKQRLKTKVQIGTVIQMLKDIAFAPPQATNDEYCDLLATQLAYETEDDE